MIRFMEDAKCGQLCVAAVARSGYVSGDAAGGYSLSSTPMHKLLEAVLVELFLCRSSVREPNGWALLNEEDLAKVRAELPNVARRHAKTVAKLIAAMPAGDVEVEVRGSPVHVIHRESGHREQYVVGETTFADVGL